METVSTSTETPVESSGTPVPDGGASETLKRSSLKVTRPRLALLGLLMAEHGPFTMEELHGRIDKTSCDLVTVYRCLSAFEEAGLVRRCDFGDGAIRFELSRGGHHHHHVICRRCRTVKNLDACIAAEIEARLERDGFSDITHSLEFFGICAECAGQPTKH